MYELSQQIAEYYSIDDYYNCNFYSSWLKHKVNNIFLSLSLFHKIFRLNYNKLNEYSNKPLVVQKMITAANLKIFLNFTQTISIMNSLNLDWENKLLKVFAISKTASGAFQDVISIECLIDGNYFVFLEKKLT